MQYDHKKIDKKWQEFWDTHKIFTTPDSAPGKDNFYLLVEFPYPSGNLHAGHWYAFAVPDILARYQRMQGKNVLYPIGFDAFGLPAENAAIKNGVNPAEWTEKNIAFMKTQIRSMGASFDWSRELATCRPDYYKWTQWLFLQLHKKGLVYRKETAVNWCPNDKTVLANEQVMDGKCDRCGSEVEQRQMQQWNIKITEYADRLIDELAELDWPEQIKEAQKNWIGRSEGAEIDFHIADSDSIVTVFTTRPDTLFGATYLVLAPEHPWVKSSLEKYGHGVSIFKNEDEIRAYVDKTKKMSDMDRQTTKEKTGAKLDGVEAINPATGENIPVFIADYVLPQYGTGAIMAVPAHDERDYEFAKKFDLPIVFVVSTEKEGVYTGRGLLIESGEFTGMDSVEAFSSMTEKFGLKKTTYRLRDWIVSRQRYWGAPIPMIHCDKCGYVPVPDAQLPVLLPEVQDYLPDGGGKSPLAKVSSFVNVSCPSCGAAAERETDTLDTFVDSSWYFLRYTDAQNVDEFANKAKQDNWMPVDMYSGGAEHTTMHLLYSRFWHKALFDIGLTSGSEPYLKRTNHGMVLGPDGQKMSKSKGNVLDPDELVARLGADTVRMYLAFMGPYTGGASYPWNPDGVVGVRRFLERVGKAYELVQTNDVEELNTILHKTIKKVGEDIAVFKFNTAISQLMILLNAVEAAKGIGRNQFKTLVVLLSPFAPHFSEELWSLLGHDTSVTKESWPKFEEKLLVEDEITYAIQVDGKTRGEVTVGSDIDKQGIEAAARAVVESRFEGAEVARVIVVPGRLVNFVLKN